MKTTVKKLGTYITNIKGVNGMTEDKMVVERRTGNALRDPLYVNPRQCKHIPCGPTESIDMCKSLAELIKSEMPNYSKQNVLVIAFAETATALGNIIADNLDNCEYVIQTTREKKAMQNGKELLTFEEEHSHATLQKIITYNDKAIDINKFTYILFVDDEISTGNTIINFMKAFKKINNNENLGFGVASVCNWQSEVNIERFKEYGIDTYSLLRGEWIDTHVKIFPTTPEDYGVQIGGAVETFLEDTEQGSERAKSKLIGMGLTAKFDGDTTFINERLGHNSNRDFTDTFKNLAMLANVSDDETIRIVGTEEFMYIPIMFGEYLEKIGKNVKCHATTRSSIDVMHDIEDYGTNEKPEIPGIKSKYSMTSLYHPGKRTTYIYNIDEKVDKVIFMTDGEVCDCYNEMLTKLFAENGYCKELIIVQMD